MGDSPGGSVRPPLISLVAADLISTIGTEMTAIALPWFVLVTTGSPARMGLVLAAEFAGLTLLGLIGARITAVVGPRRLMLAADLSRAGLIAAIPLLTWLGWLSLPVILVIGAGIGGFFPAYQASSQQIVASLLRDDELRMTRVGGVQGAANEFASFVGPALGGVLVALAGSSTVLLLDAASYLCAFALIAAMIRPAQVAAMAVPDASDGLSVPETGSGLSVMAGLRYLWHHPRLRRLLLGLAVIEISWAAMVATVPVLALHHGGPRVAGWLLGAFGAGSVIGGLLSSRTRRHRPWLVGGSVAGIAAATWVLLVPGPAWAWGLAIGAVGIGSGLFFPRFFSFVTTTTPMALRGRVLSLVHIIISAPGPVGFIGAGVLAQHSTVFSRLLIAGSATLGAAIIALGPARRAMTRDDAESDTGRLSPEGAVAAAA